MKTITLAAAAFLLVSTSAMAQVRPGPQLSPQFWSFQKIMPNGAVRQCDVSRYSQPGRGIVRTQTCYRIR